MVLSRSKGMTHSPRMMTITICTAALISHGGAFFLTTSSSGCSSSSASPPSAGGRWDGSAAPWESGIGLAPAAGAEGVLAADTATGRGAALPCGSGASRG
jgi:hypothetical protein